MIGRMRAWATWCLAGLLAVGLAAGAPGAAAAQDHGEELLETVHSVFATGDARRLLEGAAERVDVAVLDGGALYSRAQAVYVMQEFFRQYPPERVAFRKPAVRDGNWFTTGQYRYRQGERPLRVYVRFRAREGGWELREIRVEPE